MPAGRIIHSDNYPENIATVGIFPDPVCERSGNSTFSELIPEKS